MTKILIVFILAAFLCLVPIASAITTDDVVTIQNSCKPLIDGGFVKKIDVNVQPPDCVIYNITANSAEDINKARMAGIIAFSLLTYYHPEVTKGWIGIFLDNTSFDSNAAFLNIYQSDLEQIHNRLNLTQSEVIQVDNVLTQRGTRSAIVFSTHSYTKSYSEPSKESPKSITSDSSSYSNRCDQVVHVKGYTTKKGKYVAPYDRRPPGC